jgi:hypothetical protein
MNPEHKKILWGIILIVVLLALYVMYARWPKAQDNSLLENYSASENSGSIDQKILQSYTAPSGPGSIDAKVLNNYSAPQ